MKDANGWTPVYIAVREGNVDNLRLLMSKSDIDLQVKTNFGESLTFAAIDGGSVECVRLLLELNCLDWNEINKTGETPTIKAMRDDKIEIVKTLIESPKVDQNVKDIYGQSLLTLAKTEAVRDLILNHQGPVSSDHGSNLPPYVRYMGLRTRFLTSHPDDVVNVKCFISQFINEHGQRIISKRTLDRITTFEACLQELEKSLVICPEKGKLNPFLRIVEFVKIQQTTLDCCNPVTLMCLK